MQSGLPDVASCLRSFVQGMSACVIGKEHLWGEICHLLGELDSRSLDQALAQCWKCLADTFDSELGPLSRLAISIRLDYIKRVYGTTNHPEEERILRGLLAHFQDSPTHPTPRLMLNLAQNLNRQGRCKEAEDLAFEVRLLLQRH